MPIIKAITATNVINAFSGTPDGTKFLRDDGTLAAVSGYTKLVASGANDGTLTLYDDTATVGASTIQVRIGAGQTASATWYPLLQILNNAGSGLLGYPLVGTLSGSEVQICGTSFRESNNAFILGAAESELANTHALCWSPGDAYNAKDAGIARDGVGILRISNGSTGQGGLGIADAGTNTVSDALVLRHATSGTAAANFGTGLLYQGENGAGTMHDMASIDAVYVNATDAAENTELVLRSYGLGGEGEIARFSVYHSSSNLPTLLFPSSARVNAAGDLQLTSSTGTLFGTSGVAFHWGVTGTTGHFVPQAANTYDIGTSSVTVRHVYSAGMTIYDNSTPSPAGISALKLREGAAQAASSSYQPAIEVFWADGTTRTFFVTPQGNGGYTGVVGLAYSGNTDGHFYIGPTNGLTFRGAGSAGTPTQGIHWNDTNYAAIDIELIRHATNVARFADGSTGAGAVLSGRYVQAKTADYSVTPAESNSAFTNEGTAAKRNFTLPTAVANLVYTFVVQDTDGLTVTANTGDTIQDDATVSASAGNIDSTDVGATVTILAINATQWVVTSITGTWAIT